MPKKTVFIMRGLPGSGKSTFAKKLAEKYRRSIKIVSADDFMVDDKGRHKFDGERLRIIHQLCFEAFCKCLAKNTSVIVDNSNREYWEYQRYVDIATEFSYRIIILEIPCRNHRTLEFFWRRHIHTVPARTAEKMWRMWRGDPQAILINGNTNALIESLSK